MRILRYIWLWLIGFICIAPLVVEAQDKYSVLFAIGSKSNYGGMAWGVFGYHFNEKIKVELGPSFHIVYGGLGLTGGFKWEFVNIGSFSSSLNVFDRVLFRRKMQIGYGEDDEVVAFRNPGMNHYFIGTSLNYTKLRTQSGLSTEIFSLNICYGFPSSNYQTTYVDGDYSQDIEDKINEKFAEGIGFSVSYTGFFSLKKK